MSELPPEPQLVIPHDVEGLVVDLLKRRHVEHLAKLERARGLAPRTLDTLVTCVRMSDAQGVRLSGDTVPACLVGCVGGTDFTRNEKDAVDATLQLGVQVTVMGKRRRDTLLRRDCTAFTVVECLYQRLPRTGLVSAVRLTDFEPLSEADDQRTLGDMRMIFELDVPDMITVAGGLPADDSPRAPGDPGGPPDGPYELPVPAPAPREVTFTIDRIPITE